jgi:hypothetical protein
MKLEDYLKENNIALSSKGRACLAMAIRDLYPILDEKLADEFMVEYFLSFYDLPKADLEFIIIRMARYVKLFIYT